MLRFLVIAVLGFVCAADAMGSKLTSTPAAHCGGATNTRVYEGFLIRFKHLQSDRQMDRETVSSRMRDVCNFIV